MARKGTPLFLHGFDLSGHFVDLRPLGTGVTGLVLSAVDQRTGQRVAIKKLVMRDAVTVKHALREVKITQRLHHENVVRVHEVLAPYGRPVPRDPTQLSALYIIQECMETDLAQLLEQGALSTGMGALIDPMSYRLSTWGDSFTHTRSFQSPNVSNILCKHNKVHTE